MVLPPMPVQSDGSLPPGIFGEAATLSWLGQHGIPVVPNRMVTTPQAAIEAANELGYPAVLKVVSDDALHKSDVGGVRVGLTDADAVVAAFEALSISHQAAFGRAPDGVLVEPMLSGIEVLIGAKRDQALGPFVVVGSGGVLAELTGDTAVAVAPLNRAAADELISSLKVSALLDGYRGARAVDRGALIDLLVQVSQLVADNLGLVELDLNPVIVGNHGAIAVDARMSVEAVKSDDELCGDVRLPDELFEPRSVAVVGASRDSHKPGGRVLRYLMQHGYDGKIYPVNPNADEVQGVPAIGALTDVEPGSIDLACIAVPADRVVAALEQCVAAKIPAAILYTAGFAEAGAEGEARQRALVETVRSGEHRVRVAGPNSNGIISVGPRVYTAIGMVLEAQPAAAGSIALVSQSGAIGSSLLSRGWDEGVGFSRWVSVGNGADIDITEYIDYLADDPRTSVVLAFVEAIRDGAAFARAVAKCRAAGKPVVVYKTARSAAGQKAAASHTGAIAGDDRLYEAFLREVGAVRVDSLLTLLDAGRALEMGKVALGNRAGVLTMSGGVASIVADECHAAGIATPALSPSTEAALRELVPGFAGVANPMDVTAEAITKPSILLGCIEAVAASDDVDMVLVQLTTNAEPSASTIAQGIIEASGRCAKPVLVSRLGSPLLAPQGMEIYRRAGIPVLDTPERLVAAAAVLVAQGRIEQGQIEQGQIEGGA